jgi:hypothetical protein
MGVWLVVFWWMFHVEHKCCVPQKISTRRSENRRWFGANLGPSTGLSTGAELSAQALGIARRSLRQ